MADDSENVNRAVRLLREAADVLSQTNTTTSNTRPTNDHTSTSTVLTSANSPAASSSRSSGSCSSNFNNASNDTTNEALRNFRLLFSPYGSRPTPRDTQYRPPPKRVCQRKGRENTRPKETWTHEVFCLGNVDENATPTRERKETLQLAGLGRSKIKFDANSNAIEFKKKLEEVFPKLILGGGFELLRRGSSGSLVVLRQPACGYSVKYLRESSGLGQALLYIRPLQMNLDTSPEDMPEDCENIVATEEAPKVCCIKCNIHIPVTLIRIHQRDCIGNSVEDTMEEGPCCSFDNQDDGNLSNDNGKSDIRMSMVLPQLKQIFPDHENAQLQSALHSSNFNLTIATDIILGQEENVDVDSSDSSDTEAALNRTLSTPILLPDACDQSSVPDKIKKFKESTITTNAPRQLFSVSRNEGVEQLKLDILGVYKNPNTNLKSRPRVCFEGEEGVGAGPIREFLLSAVRLVEDGIDFATKPVIYFEGYDDHRVPIHNRALRQTGSFKAIGRILSHSFLHDGPCLGGLSPAIIHYFTCKEGQDTTVNPPPVEIADVPDIELQEMLRKVLQTPIDEKLSDILLTDLIQYLIEAGIDVELLHSSRELVVQGLLLYFVIEKRKLELDDICAGMQAVGLKSFIEQNPEVSNQLFPRRKDCRISAEEMKNKIEFSDDVYPEMNAKAKNFFLQYIELLDNRKEDHAELVDLCCFWSGSNMLPPRSQMMYVSFDKEGKNVFPMAESCFYSLVLPVKHASFEEFTDFMDKALKYGSNGFCFM